MKAGQNVQDYFEVLPIFGSKKGLDFLAFQAPFTTSVCVAVLEHFSPPTTTSQVSLPFFFPRLMEMQYHNRRNRYRKSVGLMLGYWLLMYMTRTNWARPMECTVEVNWTDYWCAETIEGVHVTGDVKRGKQEGMFQKIRHVAVPSRKKKSVQWPTWWACQDDWTDNGVVGLLTEMISSPYSNKFLSSLLSSSCPVNDVCSLQLYFPGSNIDLDFWPKTFLGEEKGGIRRNEEEDDLLKDKTMAYWESKKRKAACANKEHGCWLKTYCQISRLTSKQVLNATVKSWTKRVVVCDS